MGNLIHDLRYAVRTLRKSPAFLAVTVLTLALGIGANIAIFSLVKAVLLQPLPFPQPDRLVRVFDDLNGAGAKDVGMSVPELEDLRERSEVFEQISAIWPVSTALTGGERAERIEMLGTSPSYFEMLGVKPALGTVYMSAFAALALLLATLGVYGVMAFLVNQRVQEFSIRLALGAQARDIVMLALRPGLILISTGSLVGLAASIAVTRLMSGLLFGVSASDPLTFATVPVLLGIVALAACFIPGRRAARFSPAQMLRS